MIDKYLTNFETSKQLKALGLPQKTLWYWREDYMVVSHTKPAKQEGVFTGGWSLHYKPHPRYSTADVKWNQMDLQRLDDTEISAYSLSELLEYIPDFYLKAVPEGKFIVGIDPISPLYQKIYDNEEPVVHISDTPVRASGTMLMHLIMGNYISFTY